MENKVKEIYRILGCGAEEFRKVKELSEKEFFKIGEILDEGRGKSFWTHYRKDNREMEYSAPRDVDANIEQKIILKYNGELILPEDTSFEKRFLIECYLAKLGIERKIFTDGSLEKVLTTENKSKSF